MSVVHNRTDVPREAIELTEGFEGYRSKVYPDPATGGAPWTQGFGSTRDEQGRPFGPNPPDMGRDRAAQLLQRDLAAAAGCVGSNVLVALNEHQRSALISFVYNVGAGAPETAQHPGSGFLGSTLLRKLNAGDFQGAADQFLVWNRGGGRVIPGLVTRRQTERRVFLTPVKVPT